MVERFLRTTTFTSVDDYNKNLEFIIPENFNFGYDVMDVWAAEHPDKQAMLWTNEHGAEVRLTFADMKQRSDQAAAYLQQLGIGRGDMVMLILKRRLEWWISMLALHKLGAVAIPATHMLTKKDIIYRNERASVKAIICVDDAYVLSQITEALPESPTVQSVIVVGPDAAKHCPVQEGFFHSWNDEIATAPAFQRPAHVNTNDDSRLLYFTSGTSGEPKMVAHDFLYPLGHLTTGVYWHNLKDHSIHLTVADTGWGKAVWGKIYGQWIAGACLFVYDHEKFNADALLHQIEKYRKRTAAFLTLSRRPDLLSRAGVMDYLEDEVYLGLAVSPHEPTLACDLAQIAETAQAYGVARVIAAPQQREDFDALRDALSECPEIKCVPSVRRMTEWAERKKHAPLLVIAAEAQPGIPWLEAKRRMIETSGPVLILFGAQPQRENVIAMRPQQTTGGELPRTALVAATLDRFFGSR